MMSDAFFTKIGWGGFINNAVVLVSGELGGLLRLHESLNEK
jgi:hypothetical protein